MSKELKKIKKHYGEKAMIYCRDNFPLLLDTEGLVLSLLKKTIHDKKSFFKDLIDSGEPMRFKNYIYSIAQVEHEEAEPEASAEELLKSVGYRLFECKTVEDVENFKKYHRSDEMLCTFNNISGRLNTCRIFWIVKEELFDDITHFDNQREKKRQDAYGTSACSIQFSKSGNYLSIKNRYNHKVSNCDATFSNNLDNIVEGLAKAFKNDYNISFSSNKNQFDIPNYVFIDGKFYKYNEERNGIHFGDTFYQASDGNVELIDTNTQRLIGHYLLDFKEKSLKNLMDYNKDLDMTFEKIVVIPTVEEYRKEEDEKGILKICFVD